MRRAERSRSSRCCHFRCFLLLVVLGALSYLLLVLSVPQRESFQTFFAHDFPLENLPTFNIHMYPNTSPLSPGYPIFTSLLSVLEKWNPDHPDAPHDFVELLQHFNYSNATERALAKQYREAELPFKVYDVPDFNRVSRLWSKPYLSHNFNSNMKYHIEESKTNHFMYWTTSRKHLDDAFSPPTRIVSDDFTFNAWSERAELADTAKLDNTSHHWYFMTGSKRTDNDKNFVYRDFPIFRSEEPNFFIPAPKYNKGIQCRFGMRGVIAECHYDSGRNSVAMIRGSKRYILMPPEACKYLAIISDKKHPSFRHSIVDFSNIAQAKLKHFHKVKSIETVVRRGEVLYIPSFWFHYIVSLDYSIQCNSRSGFPELLNGKKEIEKCMNIKIRH